ncbi:MAG: hypothetical protein M3530_06365 [Thermoproteota archaeon]|nr:hypothetical protein [Thermoproteota archaeon]
MTEFQKIGRLRISAYNFEEAVTVKEDHPLIPQSRCFGMGGIDLSGGSMTDSAGRMTWRLSNFLCPENVPPGGLAVDFPVSFVATPLTDKPAYMTVKFIAVQPQPKDLILEVYSWDRLGEPAPFLPFYWRCRIPLTPIIL